MIFKKIIILIILSNFIFGANSDSKKLSNLFLDLQRSKSELKAKEYEIEIWNIWLTSGSTKNNNEEMKNGIFLMQNGDLDSALIKFNNLSKIEPKWAEPLNKIATIKFLQGKFNSSIKFINLTLELEPNHFGALSGLVQINILMKNYKEALKNIEKVIVIHPFISIKKLKPLILKLQKKYKI